MHSTSIVKLGYFIQIAKMVLLRDCSRGHGQTVASDGARTKDLTTPGLRERGSILALKWAKAKERELQIQSREMQTMDAENPTCFTLCCQRPQTGFSPGIARCTSTDKVAFFETCCRDRASGRGNGLLAGLDQAIDREMESDASSEFLRTLAKLDALLMTR